MPTVKNVGEPCAGEPHARFDGGREETSDSRPCRATPGASRLPDQRPQSAWTAIGILVLGLVLWLAGHWLFAFRHHFFRSALAKPIFMRFLPGWLDPTRRWNVITLDVEHR